MAGEVSRVYQLAVFDLIEVKVGTTAEMAADITVVQGAEGRAITAADNYLKQASAEELAALG